MTDTLRSAIYKGSVVHHRLLPKEHRFKFKLAMLMLDLDELSQVFAKSRLWSLEGLNFGSFYRKDYHGDLSLSLFDAVNSTIKQELGLDSAHRIQILAHPRYLNFTFNPVSFYYTQKTDGNMQAIVAEIENTPWGQRHSYCFSCESEQKNTNGFTYAFEKNFHVSPFLPMDMNYIWKFSNPGEQLKIFMKIQKEQKDFMYVDLNLQRHPISGGSLNSLLVQYPFLTFRVLSSIYWHAMLLLIKKIPLYSHPDPSVEWTFKKLLRRWFNDKGHK